MIVAGPDQWTPGNRERKSNSIEKMKASCPPIQRASESRVVEIANFVATFTSIWLHQQVGADFDAEARLGGGGSVFARAGPPDWAHL